MEDNVKALLKKFSRDERGAMMMFFALGAIPILGMSILALDIGRLYALQTNLQKAADSCALAAAAELDRRTTPDAITRANAAITALGPQNNVSFWAGTITCTPTYYTALPAADSSVLPAANITTDSK